jgi:phage baseplate assembly protein V
VSDLLRRLSVRLAGLVSRAVVKRVDDGKKRQLVQAGLLEGETRDGLEHFQPYGFTSVPLAGAEGVALFVGGERDHGLVVAVDDRRYRLTGLENGEVALYTDEGDKLVIKRGGTIEVTAATKVVVTTPLVELAGNTEAAVKGTSFRSADAALSTALTTLAAAINTYALAIQAIADPSGTATTALTTATTTAFPAAVTAYESAAAAALSVKVKLS